MRILLAFLLLLTLTPRASATVIEFIYEGTVTRSDHEDYAVGAAISGSEYVDLDLALMVAPGIYGWGTDQTPRVSNFITGFDHGSLDSEHYDSIWIRRSSLFFNDWQGLREPNEDFSEFILMAGFDHTFFSNINLSPSFAFEVTADDGPTFFLGSFEESIKGVTRTFEFSLSRLVAKPRVCTP